MMNLILGKENWNYQKRRLKEEFAILAVDDLLYEQGKKNEMLEKIRVKIGKTKEELEKIMQAF
jgi:hypothetical protein